MSIEKVFLETSRIEKKGGEKMGVAVKILDIESKDISYEDLKKKSVEYAKRLYALEIKDRSKKVLECAKFARYQYFYDGDVKKKIASVQFCKDMFCPLCQKRKAIKEGAKLNEYVEVLKEEGYGFVHLILTLKNDFDAERMREKLWLSWRDLRRRKVLDFASGCYASLEVTFSERYGYHFHLHVMLATKLKLPLSLKEYRILDNAIEKAWLDITGDSYITKLKGCENVKQFVKYICKPDDMKMMDNENMKGLLKAMKGKKTYTKTGVFRNVEIDEEDDDIEDMDMEEQFICFEVLEWSENDRCYIRRFEDENFKEITMDEVKRRIKKIKGEKKDVKGSG